MSEQQETTSANASASETSVSETPESEMSASDALTSEASESSASAKPLGGRTVMITRAREQAAEFASALEAFGARVIACPTIEIVPPESYAQLDEAIDNLFGYDWLILTSTNAVEHFLARLEAVEKDVSELDGLRVCAIGEATAERLVAAHVHVDVVPEQSRAEGVFAALENYLGGREHFEELNVLMPRAAVARDFLPRALEGVGARVDVVAAYRTVRPETTDRARTEALLVGGGVDCVTFTSSSTVHNFAQLFDTRDLRSLLAGVRVACIGGVTAQTAAEYGLRAEIVPAESNARALACAVAEFYARDAG
ncbi:MAG: uroporphyrinogen methyltransferase / synthase [Acidobacteriota bacterium]|nr:uroporphyrinogen methyltransferase / synthase [Acidobacteriota bacterium]